MKKHYDNYQDPRGDAIEGAAVTVMNRDGTLATLYTENSLTSAPLPNPVLTDYLGYYWFYIPDGRYNIRFTKEGYVTQTLTDVEIADQDDTTDIIDARIALALSRLSLSKGDPGPPGPGMPTGGNAGQIVVKRSNDDFDFMYKDESVATGFRAEVDLPIVAGVATMDNALSNNFLMVMDQNVLLANPVNYQPGDRIRLIFEQDSVGSRVLSFGSVFQFSGNVTPEFVKNPGTLYRLDLDMIKGGRWVITPFIIRYDTGTVIIPGPSTGGISWNLVSAYPWDGDGTVATPAAILDATTLAEMRTAGNNASLGQKRLARANSLIASFGNAQTLTLKRDGVTVFQGNFLTPLQLINTSTEIGVTLGTIADGTTAVAADINTGEWTAIITAGSRVATIEVGPVGSNKMAILNKDFALGNGLSPSFNLIVPRSVDGLA